MKLLLAIDIHDDYERTLQQAKEWTEQLGATLDLAYVNSAASYLPYVNAPELSAQLASELEALQVRETSQLRQLLNTLPSAHRGEVHIATGDPAASLVEIATYLATEPNPGQLSVRGRSLSMVLGT